MITVIPVGKWCPLLQYTNRNSQRSTSLLPRGQFSITLITESTPRERSSRCSLPLMKALLVKHVHKRSLTPKSQTSLYWSLPFVSNKVESNIFIERLPSMEGRVAITHRSNILKTWWPLPLSWKNYSISTIYQLEWPDCTLRNMIRERHTDTISPLLSVVTAWWPSLSRQLVDWIQYSNTGTTGEPNLPTGYHYMLHQCNK